MKYHYLDMEEYKRREHFEYFGGLAYPYVGITVNVDVTELLRKVKEEGLPFFLTVCYCAARAANRVPEFRQRIMEEKIIEFDWCRTSHTVALEDGTYCYCTLDSRMEFEEFLPIAVREQEEAKKRRSIEEEGSEMEEMLFVSTVPWVSYTSLIQPVPIPADSNPRLSWGRYFVQGDRVLMPVSVLCHHALVDGVHIGRFYEQLERQISELARDHRLAKTALAR